MANSPGISCGRVVVIKLPRKVQDAPFMDTGSRPKKVKSNFLNPGQVDVRLLSHFSEYCRSLDNYRGARAALPEAQYTVYPYMTQKAWLYVLSALLLVFRFERDCEHNVEKIFSAQEQRQEEKVWAQIYPLPPHPRPSPYPNIALSTAA